jgi:hypothetical protein
MGKEHKLLIGKNKMGAGFGREVLYGGLLNDGKEFTLGISYGYGMLNCYYRTNQGEITINDRKYRIIKVTEDELILHE